MKLETIETLASAGNKTTLAGAAVGGIGAFVASNFIGIAGIFVALLGVLVNRHYRQKADRRQAAEHELRQRERHLRIELMRATGQPVWPTHDTDLGALEADE